MSRRQSEREVPTLEGLVERARDRWLEHSANQTRMAPRGFVSDLMEVAGIPALLDRLTEAEQQCSRQKKLLEEGEQERARLRVSLSALMDEYISRHGEEAHNEWHQAANERLKFDEIVEDA